MSLVDQTQSVLEAAMSGAELRQTLLTNNVANADTPGYQPQDVNFQATLRQAITSGQSPSSVSFQPYTEAESTSADGNGVSPEQQSAQLAQNGLLYQELSDIAGQREEMLKAAIGTSS